MIRAVVFDLDGTLVNTPSAIGELLAQVLTELDHSRPADEIARTIGKPLEPSLAGLLGVDVTDPLTAYAVARYRTLFDQHVLGRGPDLLYPGVDKGLAALEEADLACAIATSKVQRITTKLLEVTGIAWAFPVVVTHDMVTNGKPHPEMGLRAAKELGVHTEQCVYVGDATSDMAMAVTAGMVALGVSYGVATTAELIEAGAETVHDSFEEVVQALLHRQSPPHEREDQTR